MYVYVKVFFGVLIHIYDVTCKIYVFRITFLQENLWYIRNH